MEAIAELRIDLFGDQQCSMEEIQRLSQWVHSSESNERAFAEQVAENMSRTAEQARLAVGVGLFILARYEEAVGKLGKGTECKEKSLYLAYSLRRLGRYEEAIEHLDNSIEHGADALTVSLDKAATYRRGGDFGSAGEELKHLANYEGVSAEYHYQLGRLQEAKGLYDEAVENYRTALELSPEHQEALFRLACRCDLAGDEEAAIDYYKQIVLRSPVHVNALLNLAVLYEDAGEFDRAGECVDKVLQFHPNHERAILFEKDIESSKTMFYDEEREKKRDLRVQILETPLSDFELSVRSRNCFRKMGIDTLGDLLRTTEGELLAYKNFGETSLEEIKVVLESKGLRLGAAVEQPDEEGDSEDETEQEERKSLLSSPVEDLNLSVRARKGLTKLDIRTLDDLVRKTDAELLGCKNFGVTSLNEIKKALTGYGLSLRTLD